MNQINNIWAKALLILAVCSLLLTGCAGEEPGVDPMPTTQAATESVGDVTEPSVIPEETVAPTEPVTTAPVETEPTTVQQDPNQEIADDAFVRVTDFIPDAIIDLKYATEDNICGKVVYKYKDAYLRYGTVKKLMEVQKELKSMGYCLKIWDAYRAAPSQFDIWEACPDLTYVNHPARGYSNHCRGNNVDVTIVDNNGVELEMPTGFDQFSALCDRDYSDCSAEAAKNAQLLEDIMVKHGFEPLFLEWWQYSDTTDYPIETEFLCD